MRAAVAVHGEMKRGVSSLAIIFCTAPLFGFLGTILGIYGSFRSLGTSRSTALAFIAKNISEAMLPTLLGLWVAVPAFWFYKYLNGRLAQVNLEMEGASSELVNRLLVHLKGASMPSRTKPASAFLFSSERPGPAEAPDFNLRRIYPNGLLPLIWPSSQSRFDAEVTLRAGLWVAVTYGLLGWFTYYRAHRAAAGLVVFAFFAVAGLGVKAGSRWAIEAMFAFLVFASVASLVPYTDVFLAACLAIASVLLLGSFKAARCAVTAAAPGHPEPVLIWKKLRPWPGLLLAVLGIWACLVVLFGTALTLYPLSDGYVNWIISVNTPLAGTIQRGQTVFYNSGCGLCVARVAGLPGDRIQVEFGQLLRNGKPVAEPYSQQRYRMVLGDFPLPSEAFPDSTFGWEHQMAYGDRLKRGTPYVVPEGTVFVLNDDRNDLEDSRVLGPVPYDYIAGRPFLLLNPDKGRWFLPRLIH